MSTPVAADKIEGIVGAPRHPTLHLARAVSQSETLYILHPKTWTLAYSDLRQCPYSHSMDAGIDELMWDGYEDKVVWVKIDPSVGDLIPFTLPDEADQ